MRPARPLALAAAVSGWLTLAAPALRAQTGPAPVVASDLFQIRTLGAVKASPDGQRVVYTVAQPYREGTGKDETFGYRTHLWLAPTDGSAPPRPLTRGKDSASQPDWHPSSDTLAFVRTVDGKPQVFLMALSGGEPWQLTRHAPGAAGLQFSPDGRRLLFTASLTDADLRREGAALPAWLAVRPGGRTREDTTVKGNPDGSLAEIRAWLDANADAGRPRVLNRLNFQSETDVDPVFRTSRLYVVDAREGAAPRAVTRGWRAFGGARWLPDGRGVVAAADEDTLRHPDVVRGGGVLYRIDVATGRAEPFVRMAGRSVFAPVVSPAGDALAFATTDDADEGFAQTELAVVPLRQARPVGAPRLLTTGFDRTVGSVVWAKDGRSVLVSAPSEGGVPVFRVPLDGEEVVRLTPPDAGLGSFDALAADAVVAARTAWDNPSELWRYDFRLRVAPRRLSDHNAAWIAGKRLSPLQPFEVTRPGPDGRPLTVQAWKMAPLGLAPGAKAPVLLQIHGGPTAMWGPGEASMWHEFQFFAARGWGVVFSNPRGSGGYGYGFQRANERDWGRGPMGDVLAAYDRALETSPWADTTRQLLTGGSYAGYLTAWIVGHTGRFDAAAAQRGVYDLGAFFGEGNAWRLVPNYFGGYPWSDSTVSYLGGTASVREVLQRESPLTYAANIRTPLLIKHGDNDRRTGFVQSEMLYRTLAVLGRDVEYARYPGATHELSRSGEPKLRLDRLLRIYEFLARYAD